MDERRQYNRYALEEQPVYCEMTDARGYNYYARILNLSQYGAKLKFYDDNHPSNLYATDQLYISGYSAGAEYLPSRIPARAVWYEGQYYGLEFDTAAYDSYDTLKNAYPYAQLM